MHILLLFTYDMSLRKWEDAGILSREIKLYENLIEKFDFQVTMVTFGDDYDNKILNQNTKIKIVPVYKDLRYIKNKFLRFIHSFIIPFYLKKLQINPTLIKTNQLNGAWIAIILKLITKTPLYIRTGYDLLTFKIKERKYIKSIFIYFLTFISLIFSNTYSVTSTKDKIFLSKFFIFKKDKLKVRSNWTDEGINNDIINRKSDSILSVGRLEKQKNYKYLLNSLAQSGLEINIVGIGSEESRLQDLVKDKNIKCNFLGNLEYEELFQIYNNYKIFVTTTLFEGNPKTILEAMSNGCVVIAPNIENISELIVHDENGILYDPSTDNLLKIINKLLSDDDKLNKISCEAIKFIEKNYSLKSYINLEISEYQSLIKF